MSYTPTKWKNKETPINADNLNKLEQGLSSVASQADTSEAAVKQHTEDIATLYQNKAGAIVATVSGEGSVSVEDTAAGGIKLLGLYGASVQDSTTGAQLLNFNTNVSFTAPTNGYIGIAALNSPFSKGAGTYYYSCIGDVGETYDMWCYDSENNLLLNTKTGQIEITEDLANNITSVRIVIIGIEGGKVYNGNIYPMISYGAEAPWEPYTGNAPSPSIDYPQEIKKPVVSGIWGHGKNLLPYDNSYKNTKYGITVEAVGDGCSYKVYGTATNPIAIQIPMQIMSKKVCTFSCDYAAGSDGNVSLYYHENGSTTTKTLLPSNSINLSTNTIESLAFFVYSGKTVNYVVKVQLEEGEATPYKPYQSFSHTLSQPIELNEGDCLTPQEVTRKMAEVVFDGSDDEAWLDVTEDYGEKEEGQHRYAINVNDTLYYKRSNAEVANAMSNYGIPYTLVNGTATHSSDGIGVYHNSNMLNTNRYLYVTSKDITSLDALREKLAETPLVVVAELNDPITEELPTADQIALNSLKSFDGTTYVYCDSEVPATIEAECVLDTKRYIDRKFAELQALILES